MSSPGTDELAVLAARAAELARPHHDDQATHSVDVLLVTVGAQQVALPVEALREVRPPTPLAPVPGDSDVLVGVAVGHTGALAVASLAPLLGLAPSAPPSAQWMAVLDDPAAPVGLLVDTADDIVPLDSDGLTRPPESSVLIAAVSAGGALLLDTAVLLGDPRLYLDRRLDPTEVTSWHHA
jgi:chemotaxis signal transduction protein